MLSVEQVIFILGSEVGSRMSDFGQKSALKKLKKRFGRTFLLDVHFTRNIPQSKRLSETIPRVFSKKIRHYVFESYDTITWVLEGFWVVSEES